MRAMTELKMERKLRYAMVGGARGSFIGPIHRMAIRMDDLADLAAGCFSRDAAMNAEVAVALGVDKDRVYADWRELIAAEKGRIDFLAVCTPNDSHYAIAKAALEAGIDVMCEKPLSITLEEAAELEGLARRRRRVLGIPFTYSGFPMVKLARELVAKGELGKIDKVVLEYSQGSFRKIDFSKPLDKRNSWKMDPRRSGRSCVVADIGVHGFHLIEYVTGLTVKKLLADLSSFAPGNRLDDDASILMRLSGGAKVSMTVSKVATGEENGVRLRVYGDKASLYWNQEENNYLSVKYPFAPEKIYKRNAPYMADASAASVRSSRIPAGHHEGFIEAFANIYAEFCAAIRARRFAEGGGEFRAFDHPGAEEGERTMRFVEAALKSNSKSNVFVAL
jgi:predicted dehydrogenase